MVIFQHKSCEICCDIHWLGFLTYCCRLCYMIEDASWQKILFWFRFLRNCSWFEVGAELWWWWYISIWFEDECSVLSSIMCCCWCWCASSKWLSLPLLYSSLPLLLLLFEDMDASCRLSGGWQACGCWQMLLSLFAYEFAFNIVGFDST